MWDDARRQDADLPVTKSKEIPMKTRSKLKAGITYQDCDGYPEY